MQQHSIAIHHADTESRMRTRSLAVLEVLCTYAIILSLGMVLRSTGWVDWEIQTLGWSYLGGVIFVGVPALVIWLTRRPWSDYGVTLSAWPAHLEIGLKAYLVRLIPFGIGLGGTAWLGMDYRTWPGGILQSITELAAVAIMLWILSRQQPTKAGRSNLAVVGALLLLPIGMGLALGRLSLVIISTVVWQFIVSGFGEEFVWRGYIQSRLNQAFGRPYRIAGVPFGAGLVVTSVLFGLVHAFNTFDPTLGWDSLSWGWAFSATCAGMFFGLLRERTGSLVACGIAHGLPDAVGEALGRVFGWM